MKFIHKFGATSQFKGVHDKIGHVAKAIVSRRERDGLSRVYTAFMFYGVLLEHMQKPVRAADEKSKWDKSHATATRYITIYAAGSAADAAGKDPAKINMVLDRSMMWDARPVHGCKSAYTFYNGNFNVRDEKGATVTNNLMLQTYPCPSAICPCASSHLVDRQELEPVLPCLNAELVGPIAVQHARLKRKSDQQEDETVILENLAYYLQNMFSVQNFIPPSSLVSHDAQII